MTYPRNLRRLSACEVVRIFSSFTGRDSRKPLGVYGFKSESMCQIAVRIIRQIAMMLGTKKELEAKLQTLLEKESIELEFAEANLEDVYLWEAN